MLTYINSHKIETTLCAFNDERSGVLGHMNSDLKSSPQLLSLESFGINPFPSI